MINETIIVLGQTTANGLSYWQIGFTIIITIIVIKVLELIFK
jgi:hypothetical protein